MARLRESVFNQETLAAGQVSYCWEAVCMLMRERHPHIPLVLDSSNYNSDLPDKTQPTKVIVAILFADVNNCSLDWF